MFYTYYFNFFVKVTPMSVIKCIVCVASLVLTLLLFSNDLLAAQSPASMYKQLTLTHPYMYHNHRTDHGKSWEV